MAAGALVGALVLPLASAPSLRAQAVQGTVTETMTGAPVGGAVVMLLGADGSRQAGALTDERGRFLLRAPGAGRYRVRAGRIGYGDTDSPWLTLAQGGVAEVPLVLEPEPVRLGELRVAGDRRCRVRPREGLAAASLWEQARRALEAAAVTRENRLVRYELSGFERDLDATGGFLLREEAAAAERLSDYPFVSRPAAELARSGFIQPSDSFTTYFMPDTQVLLSDAFLDTHCFAVHPPEPDAAGLVGLDVKPARNSGPPDIRGTLWLDATTGRLRIFEFAYVRIEPSFLERLIGGWAEFERLPTGAWIVRRWLLRLPRLASAPRLLGGQRKVLVGYREAGGEVTRASDAAGGALAGSGSATLEGVVFDSVHRRALAGATVFAAGTGRSASSDSLGRFRLEGLLPGEHTIAFAHPSLDTLGIHPPVRRMRVDSAGLAGVRLGVPARRTIVRVVCGERRRGGDDGVEMARVIDGATGDAVAGARVELVLSAPAGEPVQEIPRRDDPDVVHAIERHEMAVIPGNDRLRRAGRGDLQEHEVERVGERERERPRGDPEASPFQRQEHPAHVVRVEAELRSRRDVAVLGEDTVIDEASNVAGDHEVEHLRRGPVRREHRGDEDVGIEDDARRADARRQLSHACAPRARRGFRRRSPRPKRR